MEQYRRQLGRGFRQDCQRQIGRLRRLEGGSTYYCATAPEEIRGYVEALLRQKIDRWHQTKHSAVAMDEAAVRDFYHDVAQQMFGAGWLYLPVLLIHGQAAAIEFGAVYRGKYYSCQHSFDEAFSTYSVGRLLNLEIIRSAYERGWHAMDLGLGGEPYKYDFKPCVRQLYTVALFQTSPRGRMAEAWFRHLRPQAEHWVRDKSIAKPVREWTRRLKYRKG
jgi:CelD/BcsL family acetyltransferase involved in cellulose biosynthesis